MPRHRKTAGKGGANLGFEATLRQAADALRNDMDAGEYKHVVLGLIFLKYISDAFEEQHTRLETEKAQGADPENPDEYSAIHIFWVPSETRWRRGELLPGLTALRDTLLPKLISGEIRVKDAERTLEATLQ